MPTPFSASRAQCIRAGPATGRHLLLPGAGWPAPSDYVGAMSASQSVRPPTPPGQRPGISRRLVLLLAISTGAVVANLWYAQPLLHTLARAFRVSDGTAGLLITVTQIR
jgi:hypothetical protein